MTASPEMLYRQVDEIPYSKQKSVGVSLNDIVGKKIYPFEGFTHEEHHLRLQMYPYILGEVIKKLIERGEEVSLRGETALQLLFPLNNDPRMQVLFHDTFAKTGDLTPNGKWIDTPGPKNGIPSFPWDSIRRGLYYLKRETRRKVAHQCQKTLFYQLKAPDLDFKTSAEFETIAQIFSEVTENLDLNENAVFIKGEIFRPLTNTSFPAGFQIDIGVRDTSILLGRSHFTQENIPGDARSGDFALNLDKVRFRAVIQDEQVVFIPIEHTLPPVQRLPIGNELAPVLIYPQKKFLRQLSPQRLLMMAARACRQKAVFKAFELNPEEFRDVLEEKLKDTLLVSDFEPEIHEAIALDLVSALLANCGSTLLYLASEGMVQEVVGEEIAGLYFNGYDLWKHFQGLQKIVVKDADAIPFTNIVKFLWQTQQLPIASHEKANFIGNVLTRIILREKFEVGLIADVVKRVEDMMPAVYKLFFLFDALPGYSYQGIHSGNGYIAIVELLAYMEKITIEIEKLMPLSFVELEFSRLKQFERMLIHVFMNYSTRSGDLYFEQLTPHEDEMLESILGAIEILLEAKEQNDENILFQSP